MNNNFIVVNNPKDWAFDILGVEVIEAREYCISNEKFLNKRIRVFNLCRSYRYQSIGYYVSLIASARGHRVFPDINTIQEIKAPQLVRILAEDLDNLIQRSLKNVTAKTFELSVYFGKNISKRYDKLSREIYNLFQAPMLRAYFSKKNNIWKIQNIDVISGNQIPDEHHPYVVDFATQYFSSGIVHKKRKAPPPYDMAILVNDKDETPPSDKKAIEQFIKSAANNGFDAQIINKDSPQHIGEFDALFIRETTSVNHHTFRLAQKAAAQGIVVIDDPDSIIKCTNKVYLAELLKHNKIPLPESAVLIKDSLRHFPENRKFPIILKQPDSSYSHGIVKAENKEDFTVKAHQLFEKSDLLIAQEYIRTDFDWRVGVLDGKPLYVCKYYMAKDHWQIINWTKKGKWHLGGHECLPVENVPKAIIRTALRACNCIGKGLYGVDLKQVKDKCYVIEVNDNPSIESDVEDVVYGSLIYNTIMKVFYDRVCRLKGR
ncbi:MAG: RimK family protein [Spirochaetia bacterium]|jgi:glutathione synthase/RimK-type ligase-like ATP-grasp enzyme|nr:RimK family protein [Spirochaetia bacterium]